MSFLKQKLTWNFYTTTEPLFTTKQIELTKKKKFSKIVLDAESKIFLVYVAALEAPKTLIHPLQIAQLAIF